MPDIPDIPDTMLGGVGLEGSRLDPHKQVYRPDGNTNVIAPRHGRLVVSGGATSLGKWFDVERANRWPVARPESLYFGQALYRTAKGNWFLYSPGGDIIPASVTEVTPEEAVAFLKREGYDIPAVLKATETAQEV